MDRPPLKQVAALAGVSEPTVSRVLNGREGVGSATRERVIAALGSLGFHEVPEPRPPRRDVIGLVCGEFLNPVFPTFVHHISTELARRSYLTSIMVTDRDLAPEDRCVRELEQSGVDGLVFIAGLHAEVDGDLGHYRRLHDQGTPIVLVNGAATDLDVPHVRCDEGAGACQAVSHLVKLGHTRIGCLLGSSRYVPTTRFIAGYREMMARHGLPEPDDAIVETAFTLEGGRAGATRLLDAGITAMIAGNDLMALGAVLASRVRSGSPVSVIGYDGTDMTQVTDPPLTTLRQPFEDMAQLIVDAILSEVDGSQRYRDQYVFEPQLVARGTTHSHRPAEYAVG
jgi:DNA-binding LacI/PurR family transcriptional regulator